MLLEDGDLTGGLIDLNLHLERLAVRPFTDVPILPFCGAICLKQRNYCGSGDDCV